ncbi:MAG TPA: helix-turn-helix transcriptional regulator, partial [Actinomycetota bacterium]|nr:helix-turn-helix transcriptional regulator [Actinomycetota bacterium]
MPNRVKERRDARGWSLAELARRSGISAPNIGRIERGEIRPSLETARALSRALGWAIDTLFPSERKAS